MSPSPALAFCRSLSADVSVACLQSLPTAPRVLRPQHLLPTPGVPASPLRVPRVLASPWHPPASSCNPLPAHEVPASPWLPLPALGGGVSCLFLGFLPIPGLPCQSLPSLVSPVRLGPLPYPWYLLPVPGVPNLSLGSPVHSWGPLSEPSMSLAPLSSSSRCP